MAQMQTEWSIPTPFKVTNKGEWFVPVAEFVLPSITGFSSTYCRGIAASENADTLAIATNNELVLVYKRQGETYVESARIENPRIVLGTGFSNARPAITADGKRIAVGTHSGTLTEANRAVYVFDLKNNGQWTLSQTIAPPFPYPSGGAYFGPNISFTADGKNLAIGYPAHNRYGANSGCALLYEYNGTEYEHRETLYSPTPGARQQFGLSTIFSGDGRYLVVIKYNTAFDPVNADGTRGVLCDFFERVNGIWLHRQEITFKPTSDAFNMFRHIALNYDGSEAYLYQNSGTFVADPDGNSNYTKKARIELWKRLGDQWRLYQTVYEETEGTGIATPCVSMPDGQRLFIGRGTTPGRVIIYQRTGTGYARTYDFVVKNQPRIRITPILNNSSRQVYLIDPNNKRSICIQENPNTHGYKIYQRVSYADFKFSLSDTDPNTMTGFVEYYPGAVLLYDGGIPGAEGLEVGRLFINHDNTRKIDRPNPDDRYFGLSARVSENGQCLVVSAYDKTSYLGRLYYYARSGDGWVYKGLINRSVAQPGDLFGHATIAINEDGTLLVASSIGNTAINDQIGIHVSYPYGWLCIFERKGDVWTETQVIIPDKAVERTGYVGYFEEKVYSCSGGEYGNNLSIYERINGRFTLMQQQVLPCLTTTEEVGRGVGINPATGEVLMGYSSSPTGLTGFATYHTLESLRRRADLPHRFSYRSTLFDDTYKGGQRRFAMRTVAVSGDGKWLAVSLSQDPTYLSTTTNDQRGTIALYKSSGSGWLFHSRLPLGIYYVATGTTVWNNIASVALNYDGSMLIIGYASSAYQGNTPTSNVGYIAQYLLDDKRSTAEFIEFIDPPNNDYAHCVKLGYTVVLSETNEWLMSFVEYKGESSVFVYKRVTDTTHYEHKQTLRYASTTKLDHFGVGMSVSGDGNYLAISRQKNSSNVDQLTVFVYKRSGDTWAINSQLDASITDWFNSYLSSSNPSLALSYAGDILLIGMYGCDAQNLSSPGGQVTQSGVIKSYLRSGSTWNYSDDAIPPSLYPNERYGQYVAFANQSRKFVVSTVNYTGSNNGTVLTYVHGLNEYSDELPLVYQTEKFHPEEGAYDGRVTCALSGDNQHMLVGLSNGAGYVYYYTKINNRWTKISKITTTSPVNTDGFGDGIALNQNGTIAVIGAGQQTSTAFGWFEIWTRNADTWTRKVRIICPTALQGPAGDTCFDGVSINAIGNYITVGIANSNVNGAKSGAVALYSWNGSTCSYLGAINLWPAGRGAGANTALSGDGRYLFVGCSIAGGAGGYISILKQRDNTWSYQCDITMLPEVTALGFGRDVATNGDGSLLVVKDNGDIRNVTGFHLYSRVTDHDWRYRGHFCTNDAVIGKGQGNGLSMTSDGIVIATSTSTDTDRGNSKGDIYLFHNDLRASDVQILGAQKWQPEAVTVDFKTDTNKSAYSAYIADDNAMVFIGNTHCDAGLTGSVQVYQRQDLKLIWKARLIGPAAGYQFGQCIRYNETRNLLFVSGLGQAPSVNTSNVLTYITVHAMTDYTPTVVPSDKFGLPQLGIKSSFGFSFEVDTTGRHVMAGMPYADNDSLGLGYDVPGKVSYFTEPGTGGFKNIATIDPPRTGIVNFGVGTAMNGDATLFIALGRDTASFNVGVADKYVGNYLFVYTRSGSTWTYKGEIPLNCYVSNIELNTGGTRLYVTEYVTVSKGARRLFELHDVLRVFDRQGTDVLKWKENITSHMKFGGSVTKDQLRYAKSRVSKDESYLVMALPGMQSPVVLGYDSVKHPELIGK